MSLITKPPPPIEHLTHPKYRPDIDGLRAIAVLSVVIYHAFPKLIRGGFIGVDIFFVISGFLISTIIIGSLDRNSFSFIEFYSRRIKRIFPALILVLITSFLFGSFALFTDEYRQLGKHIAGGAGFVSNFMFWNESGYFDKASETKPLLHLWSLGIEEQFYILWPLLLWLTWKKQFNLLTITIGIAIISFALNISKVHGDAVAAFYSPQTRFWELLTGSILAYFTLHRKSIFPKIKRKIDMWLGQIIYAKPPENNGKTLQDVQSLLGAFLILIGLLVITKNRHFPGWWAILPTMGALLIISAGMHSWFNRVVLSNRVLVWFGLISFPLYLWHWPLLSFATIVESDAPSRPIRIVAVLISIALAWLTYRLIEKPIRFGNHSKTKTFILLLLMIVVGFFGYNNYKNNSLIFKFNQDNKLEKIYGSYPHQPFHNSNCDNLFPEFKDFDACLLSKEKKPDVVIVGDSHSNHYFKSLDKELPLHSVMNLGVWGCLPFATQSILSVDHCNKKSKLALSFLENEESIKTVYLAGYWSYLAAGGLGIKQDGWRQAKKLNSEESLSFQKNGEAFISALVSAKKDVILIRDIPDLNFNIKSCFNSRPFSITKKNIKSPCNMDKTEYEKRILDYEKSLSELLNKFPNLKIFDPKPIFCDEKVCSAINNDEPLYHDGDHLSLHGSNLVVEEFLLKFPIK